VLCARQQIHHLLERRMTGQVDRRAVSALSDLGAQLAVLVRADDPDLEAVVAKLPRKLREPMRIVKSLLTRWTAPRR